ncbi:SH3 domain-containing protein [Tateyamaria sp. Alg231-49]|uniref:SH3 domain-containing protein n=1 Tax=Tateyamaria sp. Alg231-49 TaxID=1922219 RepID=UPI000D54CE7D|nr:SH3 domain-containing protein [Tateyamaria sp. Alg231-49]
MWRFILISFAFLGFVFYEMSGGGEFDSEELRRSRVETPPVVETSNPETSQTAQAPLQDPEDVTRVSLSLTSVNDVLRPTNLRTQRAKVIANANEVEQTDQVLSEAAPAVILPSLIMDQSAVTTVTFGQDANDQQIVAVSAPAASAAPAAQEASAFDVRSVTGDSVNVRGGPGTDFSVVTRMVRGDKVEILQDPGQGWVQLRLVGGGPVGWMADFLLSDG